MRQDKINAVLDKPIAKELLRSDALARLAHVGADGFPRVVPVGFVWNGAEFVICTPVNAPKVKALEANPKAGLTIDRNPQEAPMLLVRGVARIGIVAGIPDEFIAATQKYLAPEKYPEWIADQRRLYPRMAVIAITPTWAKLIDFVTVVPSAIEGLGGGV